MLRVVGAGLGRTGTHSLKNALETLLGGRCYHMSEVFEHMDHIAIWHAAIRGEPVDWPHVFDGYVAAVDWPVAGVWRDVAAAYPDAKVLLSTRADAQTWHRSARATILASVSDEENDAAPPEMKKFGAMVHDMFALFEPDWEDPEHAMAAYDRHNAAVRAEVSPDRLIEWQPGAGWEPLCRGLGLPVPDEPFPHTNTTEEFLARRAEEKASTSD